MFAVALVREPLTYDQAKQLGPEVLSHCFTDRKSVRDLMAEVTIEVEEPEQCLIVRMAEDVDEHCRLRHVRIRRVKITKRDTSEEGGSRKSKKVGPQQPTLRATFECLIDSAEKTHREFLCGFFARTLFFTFEPEQENLFTGVYTDDEEDDDDDQGALELEGQAPTPDPAAGDVLAEQPKKKGRLKIRVMSAEA